MTEHSLFPDLIAVAVTFSHLNPEPLIMLVTDAWTYVGYA